MWLHTYSWESSTQGRTWPLPPGNNTWNYAPNHGPSFLDKGQSNSRVCSWKGIFHFGCLVGWFFSYYYSLPAGQNKSLIHSYLTCLNCKLHQDASLWLPTRSCLRNSSDSLRAGWGLPISSFVATFSSFLMDCTFWASPVGIGRWAAGKKNNPVVLSLYTCMLLYDCCGVWAIPILCHS